MSADAERFWAKVDKEAGARDGTGCWLWSASGRFGLAHGRSSVTPRRFAWAALQEDLGLEPLTQDQILRMSCSRGDCVKSGAYGDGPEAITPAGQHELRPRARDE